MNRWVSSPYTWLTVAATCVWLASVLILASGASGGHIPLRISLLIIALALGATILAGSARRLILSPLYLLGLIVLVFYSVLPAVYVQLPKALSLSGYYISIVNTVKVGFGPHEMVLAYHGGLGEMLVLQFAAFCFALSAFSCQILHGYAIRTKLCPIAPSSDKSLRAVMALTLVFVTLPAVKPHLPLVAEFLSNGIGREIHDAQFPLLSFCLTTLAYMAAISGRRHKKMMLIMAALVFVGLTVAGYGRITIFIILSPILLMLVVGVTTPQSLLKFSAGAFALIVCSIILVGIFRSTFLHGQQGFEVATSLEVIKTRVVSKLFARQGISGWCLDRIARDHLTGNHLGSPFFFTIAVVPRALWPGKPNLSRGSEYAVKYCGQSISAAAPHSESLTLLGEPVLNAGATGIAVAQLFLGASLLMITFLAFRGGAAGIISLTAMLPWLTVFEQHFALYTANAVKMFLFMTPLLLVLLLFDHTYRHRKT